MKTYRVELRGKGDRTIRAEYMLTKGYYVEFWTGPRGAKNMVGIARKPIVVREVDGDEAAPQRLEGAV